MMTNIDKIIAAHEPDGWFCWLDNDKKRKPEHAQFAKYSPLAYPNRSPIYTAESVRAMLTEALAQNEGKGRWVPDNYRTLEEIIDDNAKDPDFAAALLVAKERLKKATLAQITSLRQQLEEAQKDAESFALPNGCDCEPATVYEAYLQQEMRKLMRVLLTLDSAQDPDDAWRLLQHISAAIAEQKGKS
jgi:hypothetical protein